MVSWMRCVGVDYDEVLRLERLMSWMRIVKFIKMRSADDYKLDKINKVGESMLPRVRLMNGDK